MENSYANWVNWLLAYFIDAIMLMKSVCSVQKSGTANCFENSAQIVVYSNEEEK